MSAEATLNPRELRQYALALVRVSTISKAYGLTVRSCCGVLASTLRQLAGQNELDGEVYQIIRTLARDLATPAAFHLLMDELAADALRDAQRMETCNG